MGRISGYIFFILCGFVLASPACTEPAPEIYVDNHRVKCAIIRSNGDIYVDPRPLAAAMRASFTDDGGRPTINGKPLHLLRPGLVSLRDVAAAVGARLQVNSAAGIIDVITFDPHARAQAIDARERERAGAAATFHGSVGAPPPASESDHPVAPHEMDGIYQLALSQLRVTLGMGIPILPTCHFVGFDEISQAGAARGELVMGYTTWQRIDGKLYLEIYVPHGLPYARTLHIMTHELAHCWEVNFGVNLGTRVIGEGFAEWAAHSVLQAMHYDRECERSFHMPEEYTEGFKYFERMAQRIGPIATVEQVRQLKR